MKKAFVLAAIVGLYSGCQGQNEPNKGLNPTLIEEEAATTNGGTHQQKKGTKSSRQKGTPEAQP